MPLVIVTVFFILLFACEGFWFMSESERKEQELRRYQAVEHKKRNRSDAYLDQLF